MRLLHGLTVIILSFMLLSVISPASAEEAGTTSDVTIEDWDQVLSDMNTESLNLENLFNQDVITGIIGYLIALFLSLFGVSLS